MAVVDKSKALSIDLEIENLAKLADDRWREYNNKSEAEWKLSYSIWATLAAASGGLLTKSEGILVSRSVLMCLAFLFAVFSLIVHGWFLNWVHERLQLLRIEMDLILARRKELLIIPEGERPEIGRQALYVQLSITILLSVLLVGAAYLVTK